MKLLTKEAWRDYLSLDDFISKEYELVRYRCFLDGEDVDIFMHIYASSHFSSYVYSDDEIDVLYEVLAEDLGLLN